MTDFDKNEIIPDQTKTTIGRLKVVIASEADPAKKIHYTSSLISEVTSALKTEIRYWRLESTNTLLWRVLTAMLVSRTNGGEKEHNLALRAIEQLRIKFDPVVSKDKNKHPVTQESTNAALMTLADYHILLDCRKRWQEANKIYFTNNEAWLFSNAMLADIHDVVIDIANKHGMVIIPKNSFFSTSEMNNFGAMKDKSDYDDN